MAGYEVLAPGKAGVAELAGAISGADKGRGGGIPKALDQGAGGRRGGWVINLTSRTGEWQEYEGVVLINGGSDPVLMIRWYDAARGWLSLVPWGPRGPQEIDIAAMVRDWDCIPF